MELKTEGYLSIRGGGSRKIDIFAWRIKSGETPLFRAIMVGHCKGNPNAKIKEDTKKLLSYKLPSLVSKEIWIYGPNEKRIILNGTNNHTSL